MEDKAQAVVEEAKIVQLIVFNLGEEEYGAEIGQVAEIIRAGLITPIPDSPPFIKGLTNVRGNIVVVIDLKARFFLPTKEEIETRHIVITEQDNNLYGLMVDEVTEVIRVPETQIKPAPQLVTQIEQRYMSGLLTLENRLIIVVDLTKVLSEEELITLAEVSRRSRTAKDSEGQAATTEATEDVKPVIEAAEATPAQVEGTRPATKKKRQPKGKSQAKSSQSTAKKERP